MILVTVGRRTEEHCLKREVGTGSKSQFESGDVRKIRYERSRCMRRGTSRIREKSSMKHVNVIKDKRCR
jgi:hypothetical protein